MRSLVLVLVQVQVPVLVLVLVPVLALVLASIRLLVIFHPARTLDIALWAVTMGSRS